MTDIGKVVFVARRYHSNQAPLLRELRRLGWSIDFFSEYVGRSEDHSTVVPRVIGYRRRIFPPFDTRASRFSTFAAGTARAILATRPDVVVVRDFTLAALMLSLRLRRAGIPVVLYTQAPFRTAAYPLRQAWYHRCFARDVVTPADQYRAPGAPLPPARVHGPHWHYLPFVALPAAGIDARPARAPEDTVRILTIGKFTARKRLVEWIRLAARLRDEGLKLQLTVVGAPLESATLAAAEEAIRALPGSRLLVDHPHAHMPALYAAHDLFVLPSVAEPASVSQLEAMAHGLPVICSDDNGTACYVEHGATGYVFDARDWEASLARHVRRACADLAAGVPFAQAARARILRDHSVSGWDALLRRVAGLRLERNPQ